MSDVLDFPMPRAAACPFAPPPEVLDRSATKQLFRVRIWDGSTPWLVTGYEAIRSLFADGRASVDDRKPGYPHWNEGMLATVHRRPRSVFTSDAEEHTRFRRMLSRPFTYKRVEALRPAVQRIAEEHVDAILAGPKPADLVDGLARGVGQQLARMELQIVLPTLFRRVPTLRLAASIDELPFKHDALAYGLYELPVTW